MDIYPLLCDALLIFGIVLLVFGATRAYYINKFKPHTNYDKNNHEDNSEGVEDIVCGAQRFGEETVAEVMIPRVDIVDLTLSSSFSEVMTCVVENNYSRIPVTDDSHDKVKGILYVKDLLKYKNEGEDFKWQTLLRPSYFVPESKMIDDLLREFQKNKIHIAIVVDEYGSISGMVTMEDILEEIVGEIQDEYDEDEVTKHYVQTEDGSFIFDGKTPIAEFFEATNVERSSYEDSLGEAETLAGFVLELMNEIPTVGQQVQCSNLIFHVLELEKQRISKIKVNIEKGQ